MFTGIIEETGIIKEINRGSKSVKLCIEASKVLEETNWDQVRAMNRLKISRTTLWRKMHKYGIGGTHGS